jgi:DNA polymerase-3 subunit delta
MKIDSRSADRFPSAPDPKIAAVLVYGPDRGLARERATALLRAWKVDPQDPFGLVELGEDEIKSDVARLADELRAMTLTGGPRAVRIRAGGDAAAGAMAAVLGEIDSGALDPAARLIVEAGELNPRSKLRGAFESAKRAAALPCYADDARALGALLDDVLRESKLEITPDARARLLPQLEGDRALARAELEKLVLYKGLGAKEPITPEDVDAIAAGAEPVALDDVVDAILAGDLLGADRAVTLASAAGASAVGVVRALQRRLLQLHAADAVYKRTRSAEEALKALRPPLFGPRRSVFQSQLKVWSGPRLDGALAETLRTETRLKSTGAADETLLSRLALALAGQAKRARR